MCVSTTYTRIHIRAYASWDRLWEGAEIGVGCLPSAIRDYSSAVMPVWVCVYIRSYVCIYIYMYIYYVIYIYIYICIYIYIYIYIT